MSDDGQLGLFDVGAARHAGEAGMDRAYNAERVQRWKSAADRWLDEQPRGAIVRADALVEAIGLPDASIGERERPNNVVGAWFSAQAKRGRLVWTGRYGKSARVVGHGNPQRLWLVNANERGST